MKASVKVKAPSAGIKSKQLLEQILLSADMTKEQIDLNIKSFLFDNAKDSKSNFDLFKFCGKDTHLRPGLTGVFYSKGFAVASDANALVVVKSDYLPENEGKIINRKNEIVPAVYPNFSVVAPGSDLLSVPFSLPLAKDFLKKAAIDKKAKADTVHAAQIGGLYFSVPIVKSIVSYVEQFAPEAITVNTEKLMLYCVNTNGSWGVFMPLSLSNYAGAVTDLSPDRAGDLL
jgi:hypothetical protein